MKKRTAPNTDDKIAHALLALALRKPFLEITSTLLAKKSGVSVSTLNKRFKNPSDRLIFIIGYADQIVAQQFKKNKLSGPAQDQLFELIMARLDWLQKNRKAVIQIGKVCWDQPDLMLVMVKTHWLSAKKMLDILNISLPKSALARAFLFILYEFVLQLWLQDKEPDMDKTMAGLNRILHKFSPYC